MQRFRLNRRGFWTLIVQLQLFSFDRTGFVMYTQRMHNSPALLHHALSVSSWISRPAHHNESITPCSPFTMTASLEGGPSGGPGTWGSCTHDHIGAALSLGVHVFSNRASVFECVGQSKLLSGLCWECLMLSDPMHEAVSQLACCSLLLDANPLCALRANLLFALQSKRFPSVPLALRLLHLAVCYPVPSLTACRAQ